MDNFFTAYLQRIEEEISRALPAAADRDWVISVFGDSVLNADRECFAPLLGPTRSLVDLGGKRWRPLLLVLSAEAYAESSGSDVQAAREKAFGLVSLVEFIHTASLIHDDIEDSSDTRRGKPAAYITYGLDTALNAASWLYFHAPLCIDRLAADDSLKNMLYVLYTRECRKLHLGQAMDIKWHRNPEILPVVGEYETMVSCKTGTLSALACKTGVLVAGGDRTLVEKAGRIARKIGVGFQIVDDVVNLTTGNPGKKRGDDIVEGKKSLPVLLFAMQEGSDIRGLSECFVQARKEGVESPAVERAIGLLHDSGQIKNALERGVSCIQDGCSALEDLFPGSKAAGAVTRLFTSMIPSGLCV